MIRLLDVIFAFAGLLFLWPVIMVIAILGYFDTGAPIFKQIRVGRNQQPFTLVKFRTMPIHTRSMATHLVSSTDVTPLGRFLRRTKLDELPQLINVLRGDMSLVGPRPCLFNQTELIEAREKNGIFDVRPGITGLAQINGIDMSDPQKLAQWDKKMLTTLSLKHYFFYIISTAFGKGTGDRTS
ncbi:sugar transferase [Salinivibrio sp. YCSC6]|uniref:sugar transferase n=1 Tax=Salinivibrio sp. YCSC6 TaxID=2003370 RepID=UPI000BBC73A0|nr:sugar transferase [Salinivibrio sp. YCSC6]PCE67647.1 lipid carrier--UDP-N-acetylgalactosaminyltransferase [Salinivibrio sp. YCSC6]QCF35453.1 sugar transferase [Salinivibrio sp. YCSC6]